MARIGKEIGEWRKAAPRRAIIDPKKLDDFREAINRLLQNIEMDEKASFEEELCNTAINQGIETAKEFVLKTEKKQTIDIAVASRLIHIMYDYSKEQY